MIAKGGRLHTRQLNPELLSARSKLGLGTEGQIQQQNENVTLTRSLALPSFLVPRGGALAGPLPPGFPFCRGLREVSVQAGVSGRFFLTGSPGGFCPGRGPRWSFFLRGLREVSVRAGVLGGVFHTGP